MFSMWKCSIVLMTFLFTIKCSSSSKPDSAISGSSDDMEKACSSYCFPFVKLLLHYSQHCVLQDATFSRDKEFESNKNSFESQLKDKEHIFKLMEKEIKDLKKQISTDSALVKDQKDQIAKFKQQHEYLPHNCPNGATNGIHLIKVLAINEPFLADCDSAINGPGWMVIQRRMLNAKNVSFLRSWAEYRTGFGENQGNYFIGMEKLHLMTKAQSYELYIHLQSDKDETKYALYDNFVVANENESYKLKSLGKYTGNAGDSLSHHVNFIFQTFDHRSSGCPLGWWVLPNAGCGYSNLNAHEFKANHSDSIHWGSWKPASLKVVQMMIRPRNKGT